MAKIIPITDLNAAELDIYARLTEKQIMASPYFVAESPEVIRLALNGGMEAVSFLMEEKYINTTAKDLLAQCAEDIPVYAAKGEVIASLTGFHLTRGVLCAMKRPALPSVEKVTQNARRVAVLENVMNPTNIGAVFRSAAALNIDALILTDEGSDPLCRRATRTAMGTMFQMPWTILPKYADTVTTMKKAGFKTVAMVLREDSRLLTDAELNAEAKLAIILGNEGHGLKEETVKYCDYPVMIPMSHGVDSLNVSTAAAIAFYQLGVVSGANK